MPNNIKIGGATAPNSKKYELAISTPNYHHLCLWCNSIVHCCYSQCKLESKHFCRGVSLKIKLFPFTCWMLGAKRSFDGTCIIIYMCMNWNEKNECFAGPIVASNCEFINFMIEKCNNKL